MADLGMGGVKSSRIAESQEKEKNNTKADFFAAF
jgi:hypothetical protein